VEDGPDRGLLRGDCADSDQRVLSLDCSRRLTSARGNGHCGCQRDCQATPVASSHVV
jgi:hypothetical protein